MTLRGTTRNAKNAKARSATPTVPSASSRTGAGKVRLGDVFDLQMGKTPARANPEYWGGSNKWISIADIGNANIEIIETAERITDKAIAESGIKLIPANTLIMSFKLSIGKTAITAEPMYSNEAIMAFLPRESDRVNLRYLYHQFANKDWSAGSNNAVVGVTLNKKSLQDHEVIIPPLPTQQRIAAELDRLCALKKNAEDRLAILDQIVKSRFVEMFGDVEEGSAKFKVVHLIDVCTSMSAGKDVPEDYVKVKDSVHQVPIYSNGVENDGLYGYASEPRIFEPSLTISGRGTIGYVCRREVPFVPIIRLIVATPNKDIVDLVFLQWALKDRCAKNTGTTIPQLPVPAAKSIKVILPPLALQREFAAFVAEVDKSKAALRETVATLDQLYRAKLQEYFG